MKQELLWSQIESITMACPYCHNETSQDDMACCGEASSHFETAYITESNEMFLESEVTIIHDEQGVS